MRPAFAATVAASGRRCLAAVACHCGRGSLECACATCRASPPTSETARVVGSQRRRARGGRASGQ
eukprot:1732109-Alexandrium_andersonii.AAC.1